MIEINLPGRNQILSINHLLLDLNGTLALDGVLVNGVKERVAALREKVQLYLLTADTMGTGKQIAVELGIELIEVHPEHGGQDKYRFMMQLVPPGTAAIGNGYNDIYMLREAALAIAVIGPEGCAYAAIQEADIVVNHICDALDLLLNPLRVVATLRV